MDKLEFIHIFILFIYNTKMSRALLGYGDEDFFNMFISNILKIDDENSLDDYTFSVNNNSELELKKGATLIATFTTSGITFVDINAETICLTASTAATITFKTDSNPVGTVIGGILETFIISNQDTAGDIQFVINGNDVLDIENDGNLVLDGIASSGTIRFNNNNTGNTTGDGTIIGLTSSTFIINNQEATNINIQSQGANAISVDSSAMVGIQQTSPVALLHLGSDTTTEMLRFDTERAWYIQQGGSGSGASLDLITEVSGKAFRIMDETSGNISFRTSASTTAAVQIVALVESGGMVGIGNSTPTYELDIIGEDIRLDSNSTNLCSLRMDTTNSSGQVLVRLDNGDIVVGDFAANGGDCIIRANGTNVGVFTEPAAFGIGNFTPQISLAIGDADTGLDQVSDGVLRVMTNNVEKMRFGAGSNGVINLQSGSGGVGINQSSPSALLDIDGGSEVGLEINLDHITLASDMIFCFNKSLSRFIVKGDGDCENRNNSYGGLSDSRLKKNVVPCNSQWDDIKNIEIVNYNFINEDTTTHLGCIAQQVELVSSGLVRDTEESEEVNGELVENIKTIKYSVMYMKGMKALQEAMLKIEDLEERLSILENI